MQNFQWLNESGMTQTEDVITIHAPARTDFFNFGTQLNRQGLPDQSVGNAPYYYTLLEGDFVLRVKVSLQFQADYDACAILLMKNEKYWGKLCFEKSDFGTHAVVSVVTNVRSDDANGCNVEGNSLWLKAVRTGHYFAFHYSLDGVRFDMTRLFWLETDEPLKVGLVAQSPLGEGGLRHFEHLTIERKTVKNLRRGE